MDKNVEFLLLIPKVEIVNEIYGENSDYIMYLIKELGGTQGFTGEPLQTVYTIYKYYVNENDILHLDAMGDNFYHINCEENHPDNYKNILEIVSLFDSTIDYKINNDEIKNLKLNKISDEYHILRNIKIDYEYIEMMEKEIEYLEMDLDKLTPESDEYIRLESNINLMKSNIELRKIGMNAIEGHGQDIGSSYIIIQFIIKKIN